MRKPRTDEASGNAPRESIYQQVTSRIIADLERGTFPWAQPWGRGERAAALGLPRNAATAKTYSGINVLILWGRLFEGGFASQNWLTFRQAKSLGGSVRKGEKGTTVCYADTFIPKSAREKEAEKNGERTELQAVPFLRRYTVFNVEQCEGLPAHCLAESPPLPERQIVPEAEALARATLADIRIGGARAFYRLDEDAIHLPPQPAFFDQINYYRTLFHELGHWTGHPRRLARDFSGAFGSHAYACEELVAEIATAFVCASLNIVPTVRHADYIGNWLSVLREDSRAIFRAAREATKAADYILAFRRLDSSAQSETVGEEGA
jgi:antirestriction protein ArdC